MSYTYEPQGFDDGQILTAEHLNTMETGIATNSNAFESIDGKLNKILEKIDNGTTIDDIGYTSIYGDYIYESDADLISTSTSNLEKIIIDIPYENLKMIELYVDKTDIANVIDKSKITETNPNGRVFPLMFTAKKLSAILPDGKNVLGVKYPMTTFSVTAGVLNTGISANPVYDANGNIKGEESSYIHNVENGTKIGIALYQFPANIKYHYIAYYWKGNTIQENITGEV